MCIFRRLHQCRLQAHVSLEGKKWRKKWKENRGRIREIQKAGGERDEGNNREREGGGGGDKRGTEMGRMNEKRRERVERKGRRKKQKMNSAK